MSVVLNTRLRLSRMGGGGGGGPRGRGGSKRPRNQCSRAEHALNFENLTTFFLKL